MLPSAYVCVAISCSQHDLHVCLLQVLQGILDQPQAGRGAIEKQSVRAQALLMLAKVHKVCPVCLQRMVQSVSYLVHIQGIIDQSASHDFESL